MLNFAGLPRPERRCGFNHFRQIEFTFMDQAANTTDAQLSGRNSQGMEIQARLVRFTRHLAVFEYYAPAILLHLSEVLTDFKITFKGRAAYAGRAVVINLIETGTAVTCEVTLEESWLDTASAAPDGGERPLPDNFRDFMSGAQKTFKILPEFKIAVADLQMYCSISATGWTRWSMA